MKRGEDKNMTVCFTPGLAVDDPLGRYWMRQVTIRLRREIAWLWHQRCPGVEENPGILPPIQDRAANSLELARYANAKREFFEQDATAHHLSIQLLEKPPAGMGMWAGSFSSVVANLELDQASTFVLALGLMATIDSAMGSVVATCLNDPGRSHPSWALAQQLWDQPEAILQIADPFHPLFRYGLLRQAVENQQPGASVDWDTPLAVPLLAANQMLFADTGLPRALAPIAFSVNQVLLGAESAGSVITTLRYRGAAALRIVPLFAPKGSDYAEAAAAIGGAASRPLVEFRGDAGLIGDGRYLGSLAGLCWLRGLDLFFDQDVTAVLLGERLRAEGGIAAIAGIPVTMYVSIQERNQLAQLPENHALPPVELPPFTYQQRISHWHECLGAKAVEIEKAITKGSRRFRFPQRTISHIAASLKAHEGPVSETEFIAACMAELNLNIGELAQRVTPRFTHEKLILPYKQDLLFRELITAMKSLTEVHYGWGTARVWNESGIAALFAGPPGTGKTMAAEILAIKLGLPMYRIDLSQVVNKYIGETEKNLKRLFDAADVSDTILFFDEADSLFGRRTEVKDAHDRYANLEISYLLERMERFKGLAILSTNRKKDLDEAFLRRLRYIIDFPLPGIDERIKIWRQVIPEGIDTRDIDFEFLARQFPFSGGHISSSVFNACLQSAGGVKPRRGGFKGRLEMEPIIIAVKREYDKLNQFVNRDQFGRYAKLLDKMEKADANR